MSIKILPIQHFSHGSLDAVVEAIKAGKLILDSFQYLSFNLSIIRSKCVILRQMKLNNLLYVKYLGLFFIEKDYKNISVH